LPPYRALARELKFCNAAAYGCGRITQAINGLARAEKRLSEGEDAPWSYSRRITLQGSRKSYVKLIMPQPLHEQEERGCGRLTRKFNHCRQRQRSGRNHGRRRFGRIEEADHIDVVLEVGVQRIGKTLNSFV
jgi:hypothetical protein